MKNESFADYYELLQVSPNADETTIHRVFRHLAKQEHPDAAGGNADDFNRLVEAYRTLRDPATRAAYDVRYQQYWERKWKLAADSTEAERLMDDEGIRERLLSLFYTQRRRNMRNPGLGEMELARLVGCPVELIEFHIWYLKEKAWIVRLETGLYAITAAGVDAVESERPNLDPHRLIETAITPTETDGDAAAASPTRSGRGAATRGA